MSPGAARSEATTSPSMQPAGKTASVMAAGGLVLVAAMFVASVLLSFDDGLFANVLLFGWLSVLGATGALVAARRSRSPEGWLMLGSALLISLFLFADAYASHSVASPKPLPLEGFFAWLTLWVTVPGFGMLMFLILLFPTGKLVSPRWRWIAWVAAIGLGAQSLALAFRPGEIDVVPGLNNPLGIELARGVAGSPMMQGLFAVAEVAAVVSLIVRFRRARGTERQQMRWFVLSVLFFILAFIGAQALFALAGEPEEGSLADLVGFGAIMLGLTFIPVAMGIGIVRHGLYDIDRLINRTLVYGAVTIVLAAIYLATVLVMQSALPIGEDSPITVAASTLAVVALFRPARKKVQSFVDRRFNRSRNDAARTIEGFGAHVRRHTDLEALTVELLAVTKETMQPAHASLWLKAGGAER